MEEKTDNVQFSKAAMQANFSSILYLLSEQQAMIGKLFQALLDNQVIDSRQLTDITDTTSGEDGLVPTYTQLYNRFALYYLRTKHLLESEDLVNRTVDDMFEDEGKEKEKKDE